MANEWLKLDSWRFTTVAALAREVKELLEHSSYKIEVRVHGEELEILGNELEGWKTLGRLKVKQL